MVQSWKKTNSALVRQAFEDWEERARQKRLVICWADDAEWVVAGVSPVSATYPNPGSMVEEAVSRFMPAGDGDHA